MRPSRHNESAKWDLGAPKARGALAPSSGRGLMTLATIALVAVILSLAQDVLMPLALAILLAFVLAPMVRLLERTGLPRMPAVLATVLLVSVLVGGIASIVVSQSIELAAELPGYRETIRAKFEAFTGRDGPLENIESMVGEIEHALPKDDEPDDEPLEVTVVPSGDDRLRVIRALIGPVIGPAATAALVFIFVLFLLFDWNDLRDRLVRLSGAGQIHVTQRALEDAGGRVSHYLGMQLLINGLVGLAVGVGLGLIGVPSPVLWGLLSMALRFIPYVGPWLAAAFPILVSFAASPGWSQTLQTVGLFVAIELVANNLLEPLLYGRRTGITPIGIIVSAVFWGWLWGGVGLVLATPLTVCLLVAGRYVQKLEFLTVLLSDEQALLPHQKLYHRLVALDLDEANEVIESYRADHDLVALCDDVLIPALTLAERDRHQGALSDECEEFVYAQLHGYAIEPDGDGEVGEDSVFCVPGLDVADEISAEMLAGLLRSAGSAAAFIEADEELGEVVDWVASHDPHTVIVCVLPPFGLAQARRRIRKLRARFPRLRVLAGVWSAGRITAPIERRLREAGAGGIFATFAEAVAELGGPADGEPTESTEPTDGRADAD